jgi:hypothetical protein
LAVACAPQRWAPRPAEHPPTWAELQVYALTVHGPPALAQALAAKGFRVVSHEPYKGDLLLEWSADGVATLRSDGFFVDEAAGDFDGIARELAVSQRVADFIRNSGLPQQRDVLMQSRMRR